MGQFTEGNPVIEPFSPWLLFAAVLVLSVMYDRAKLERENARLRSLAKAMAGRIEKQSVLLARRAER